MWGPPLRYHQSGFTRKLFLALCTSVAEKPGVLAWYHTCREAVILLETSQSSRLPTCFTSPLRAADCQSYSSQSQPWLWCNSMVALPDDWLRHSWMDTHKNIHTHTHTHIWTELAWSRRRKKTTLVCKIQPHRRRFNVCRLGSALSAGFMRVCVRTHRHPHTHRGLSKQLIWTLYSSFGQRASERNSTLTFDKN